jgi:hypothetical protein
MATTNLPTRTKTAGSDLTDDEAVPGEDTSALTKLLHERLQAWKHAVKYIEDYVEATEKVHHSHHREYEKVLKTVSHPIKEGHQFDQQLGGVAGIFDNLRSNTQGIANSHQQTAKSLKSSVLPIFNRLHSEIKNKQKELTKGAGKNSKAVDKSRNETQKQIEFLGQHTAAFDSAGGKITATEDPYVLQRMVRHKLHKQVMEENSNRNDLLSVQNSFSQFEAHIVKTIQTGMGEFNQVVSTQTEQTRNMYGNMTMTTQAVRPDFEWKGFVSRNSELLIDPAAHNRSVASISFPNQDHRSTQPLIAGSLQRKSKLLKKYDTNYYVVSPAKYLHEFSSDDDFSKDPSPEMSLYLPDCSVGAIDGARFNVKGKDVSKGTVGKAFAMNHEFTFKAHTPGDASKWWEIIRNVAGQQTTEVPDTTAPNTPVDAAAPALPASQANTSHSGSSVDPYAGAPQSAGATGGPPGGTTAAPPTSALTATPTSATSHNSPYATTQEKQALS